MDYRCFTRKRYHTSLKKIKKIPSPQGVPCVYYNTFLWLGTYYSMCGIHFFEINIELVN